MSLKKRLASLFHETGSYRTGNFTLASGKTSSCYIDCKNLSLYPEALHIIACIIEDKIDNWSRGRKVIDAVGGMVIGADPIVGALVERSYGHENKLTGFLIRKEPKKHGTKNYIEGPLQRTHHTVLIEDVVTTGSSVLEAAKRIWDYGASVAFVMTVVDREEGGREAMDKYHLPLFSALTLSDLRRNHES